MVTYKTHTSSKAIYTMGFKHTSMEDGPTMTQIQLLLSFVVVCVIWCVGEETILYTCLERGVMATGRKDMVGGRKLVSFLSHSISLAIYLCLRERQSNVFALGETQYWTRIWTMSVNRFSSAKYSHSIVGTTLSTHPYPTPQKWFTTSISHNILSIFLFLSSISISRSHITNQYTTADTPSKSSRSTSVRTKNLIPHNRYIILCTLRYIYTNRYITRNSLILTIRVHNIFVRLRTTV